MALLKDITELEEKGVKGDWCFSGNATEGEDAYICLLWGNDAFKNLSILPIKPNSSKPYWLWNGDKESPTLSPSILVHPYPGWTDGWHGFLQNGVLKDA